MHVVKTKALISCAVTTQLICGFIFTYAKSKFLMTQLNFLNFVSARSLKRQGEFSDKGFDESTRCLQISYSLNTSIII